MLSVIVINCVFDVILLEESSACHITAVWPEGKIYPSGILFVIVGKGPQLSAVFAAKRAKLQSVELTSPGIVKLGSSLSITIIVWVTVVTLDTWSVIYQVILVTPLGYWLFKGFWP